MLMVNKMIRNLITIIFYHLIGCSILFNTNNVATGLAVNESDAVENLRVNFNGDHNILEIHFKESSKPRGKILQYRTKITSTKIDICGKGDGFSDTRYSLPPNIWIPDSILKQCGLYLIDVAPLYKWHPEELGQSASIIHEYSKGYNCHTCLRFMGTMTSNALILSSNLARVEVKIEKIPDACPINGIVVSIINKNNEKNCMTKIMAFNDCDELRKSVQRSHGCPNIEFVKFNNQSLNMNISVSMAFQNKNEYKMGVSRILNKIEDFTFANVSFVEKIEDQRRIIIIVITTMIIILISFVILLLVYFKKIRKPVEKPPNNENENLLLDNNDKIINRARYLDNLKHMGFDELQCAVIEGSEKLCNELLKNGFHCFRYVEGFQQSHFKETVLPISTRENAVTLCIKMHGTIYQCFLDKLLDIEKVNCSDGNENTLLHIGVKALLPDLCKTLLNYRANIEAINKQGNSPLFELFSQSDQTMVDDNIDKIITISNILIDSGADINKKLHSGVTVFESASQCNSERLMLYLLSKNPDLKIIRKSEFNLAFLNKWFDYAEALIDQMPEDSLKSFISTEIFLDIMPNADPKLLKSLFAKARSDVQQSIIEELLRHFASKNEYDLFLKLLETKVIKPKQFSNGETLFTGLLKDKDIKYCWAIIQHAPNTKSFNFANRFNQIPLQVAIEREFYDLIGPLIVKCDQLNNEDIKRNTPLMQLFQKLSRNTDNSKEKILMDAVKSIISKGGDIYKETSTGKRTIDFCQRLHLKAEIEAFQNTERNRNNQMIEGQVAQNVQNTERNRNNQMMEDRVAQNVQNTERNRNNQMMEDRVAQNICIICRDRELDSVFDCGHTSCTPCSLELYRCHMCNAEPTNPRKMYIN